MTYRAILKFGAIAINNGEKCDTIIGLVNGMRIDELTLSKMCLRTGYRFEKYNVNIDKKFRKLSDLYVTNDIQCFTFISTKLRDKFVSEVNTNIDNINKMKGSFGGI